MHNTSVKVEGVDVPADVPQLCMTPKHKALATMFDAALRLLLSSSEKEKDRKKSVAYRAHAIIIHVIHAPICAIETSFASVLCSLQLFNLLIPSTHLRLLIYSRERRNSRASRRLMLCTLSGRLCLLQ